MELTDKDLMEFGKHKGSQMQDVPADWLLWYYGELTSKLNNKLAFTDREKSMYDYITDNLEVLKKEKNQK